MSVHIQIFGSEERTCPRLATFGAHHFHYFGCSIAYCFRVGNYFYICHITKGSKFGSCTFKVFDYHGIRLFVEIQVINGVEVSRREGLIFIRSDKKHDAESIVKNVSRVFGVASKIGRAHV